MASGAGGRPVGQEDEIGPDQPDDQAADRQTGQCQRAEAADHRGVEDQV
jgi:hypothetical protein